MKDIRVFETTISNKDIREDNENKRRIDELLDLFAEGTPKMIPEFSVIQKCIITHFESSNETPFFTKFRFEALPVMEFDKGKS